VPLVPPILDWDFCT